MLHAEPTTGQVPAIWYADRRWASSDVPGTSLSYPLHLRAMVRQIESDGRHVLTEQRDGKTNTLERLH